MRRKKSVLKFVFKCVVALVCTVELVDSVSDAIDAGKELEKEKENKA